MRATLLFWVHAAFFSTLNVASSGAYLLDSAFNEVQYATSHGNEFGFFVNEQVPSIPLIVKTPYLQAWMPVGSRQPHLAGRWCEFWTGQQQGWTGFVRVDGHAYTFMGDPSLHGQSLAIQKWYKVGPRL